MICYFAVNVVCLVCRPGETQRCMTCRAANDAYCDATGHFVSCQQNVSFANTQMFTYRLSNKPLN